MHTTLMILVGLTFLVTGGVKILSVPQSLEIRDHLGIAPGLWRIVGTLETLGAVGVLVGLGVELIGTLALIGLTLLMLGAIASRIRVRDSVVTIGLDAVVLALVAATLTVHVN